MIDVLFVYEHKVREIETIIAIKTLLELEKLKVEIIWVRNYARLRYFLYKKPRLIVIPYLYTNKELYDTVISICGNITKIINLQWEQVFNGESIDIKSNPKGIPKDAVHICWGKVSYERLKKTNTKNLLLSGAPQLDFLRSTFNDYFYSKKEIIKKYKLNPQKKMILFISSFSYYSLSDSELNEIQPLVDFDTYFFRTITIKSKNTIIEWFKLFLEEYKDYQIIYRPHPAELKDQLLENFKNENEDFIIISNESVKQWIKVSDIVLNWYSTSGVEAYFAGKSNYFLRPYTLPDNLEYQMYVKAPKVTNYLSMVNIIRSGIKEKKVISNEIIYEINKFYLYTDQYACKNIANKIIEMLKTDQYDIKYNLCSKYTILKAILKNIIKHIIIKNYKKKTFIYEYFLSKNKFLNKIISKIIISYKSHLNDYISEEEIRYIYSRMKYSLEKLHEK